MWICVTYRRHGVCSVRIRLRGLHRTLRHVFTVNGFLSCCRFGALAVAFPVFYSNGYLKTDPEDFTPGQVLQEGVMPALGLFLVRTLRYWMIQYPSCGREVCHVSVFGACTCTGDVGAAVHSASCVKAVVRVSGGTMTARHFTPRFVV